MVSVPSCSRCARAVLVLFVVTAALAVLLAVRYHLTGPTVAVAILGGVPTLAALYLAWAALPGAIIPPESAAVKKPAYGRLAGRWDAVELGVHQVIGGGPMPAHVRRPHDELLRAVLDPADHRQPAGGGPRWIRRARPVPPMRQSPTADRGRPGAFTPRGCRIQCRRPEGYRSITLGEEQHLMPGRSNCPRPVAAVSGSQRRSMQK